METWFRQQSFYKEARYNKIIWWTTEGYKEYIEEKPPYRIIRKRNEGLTTYHYELWTVDEQRNLIKCIRIGNKKKDIDISDL